ncbi:MAG: hypothetical protein WC654_00240 [Patescibacteria group bacterium]
MDLIENIVASWFNAKGYFVIQNLKVGVYEVDLLAVKLNERQEIEDAVHVEVQCSSNPIGYIGGSPSAKKRTNNEIEAGVQAYIDKKFEHSETRAVISNLLGQSYRRLFICGKLKDEITIEFFKQKHIEVLRVWEIFEDVKRNNADFKTGSWNRYHQLLHLGDVSE